MSNMPEVEHLFTLAASAPVSSLWLTRHTLCVGARPRTAWKAHIISHVQQQTSIMIGVYELLYLGNCLAGYEYIYRLPSPVACS